MSEIPEYLIEQVAKALCKANGDRPNVKTTIGEYAIKKEVSVWQTYLPAAHSALEYGCDVYNNGLRQ